MSIRTTILSSLCVFSLLFGQQAYAHSIATIAPQSTVLARVNGQDITLNDIDSRIREAVEKLESDIAAARTLTLEDTISEMLFDLEAKRRRITLERLLAIEVLQRVPQPTAEQIQAIYDANRLQFGATTLPEARPQIVAYLRTDSMQQLTAEFAKRVRTRHSVVLGANINTPKLASSATVATVDGRIIPASVVLDRLKPMEYEMRMSVYQAETADVELTIYNRLVLEEARRRNVEPEVLIRNEVTETLRGPTQTEVEEYYKEYKEAFPGGLESARVQIVDQLSQAERAKAERALSAKLRASANVQVLLVEPVAPVIAISIDNEPSRGDVNAPVTMVVFTDFQCPACRKAHPIIDETAKSYGNKVRLVIRNFPLERHPNARKAAEAAAAAFAQGKFFEYVELLFRNQEALDVPSLKKYATQAGLNRVRFDAELTRGQYATEINRDVKDGLRYGVSSTPSVFINGVRIRDISQSGLHAAIDRALAAGQPKTSQPAAQVGSQ